MRVLLSIKPDFANKIFSGEKKFEFRRAIFRNPHVKTIVVYASSPVQKVIGEFDVDCILNYGLDELWGKTCEYAGITKNYFLQYFREKECGYAIKIKQPKLYPTPKCIRADFNVIPPQSFLYLAP